MATLCWKHASKRHAEGVQANVMLKACKKVMPEACERKASAPL
jgi:hypothetical protein